MAVRGFFICWPDTETDVQEARVARCHSDLQHHNTLAFDAAKTYVYWASPRLLTPAFNWHLHAASIDGRDHEFDPSRHPAVRWEHFSIQEDGLTDFEFSSDRSYAFYITLQEASDQDLRKKDIPWPVYVYQPEDAPEQIRILFPAQPLDSDQHGDEYAANYDLRSSIGTPLVFNSDEHLELADEAQKLVDYYALNGLIDGGVLIRYTDQPLDKWDILTPDPQKDPAQPYGTVREDMSYHWHYVIPSAVFSSPTYAQADTDPGTLSDFSQPAPVETASSMRKSWTAQSLRNAIISGDAATLSIGQIIMLAGDFFGSLDEMKDLSPRDPVNIMKGVDERARFAGMIVDVASLEHSSWGSSELGQKQFMEDVSKDPAATSKITWNKVTALVAALRQISGKKKCSEIHTLAHTVAHTANERLAQLETLLPWAHGTVRTELLKALTYKEVKTLDKEGFNDEIFNMGVTNGHYAALALDNVAHFDPANWQAFKTYHTEALESIDLAINAGASHPIPADAVAHTAFGLHFLTDSFSAGHMRVPRAQLGEQGSLAAKLMHDMDGYYGLQVTDGFGHGWRAYGDGNLRRTTLAGHQQKILKAIKKKNATNVSTDAETNWEKVKAVAGAAFKQLHFHAQRYYSPAPADGGSPTDLQRVLRANRGHGSSGEFLFWEQYSKGKAAEGQSLEKDLAVDIKGRLAFMKKYVPVPNPEGRDVLQNHPPLFLKDGSLNTAAGSYFLDTGVTGLKRYLVLRWHGNTGTDIEINFSKYYYLARFTAGAALEKWVPNDETRLVGVLDGLPKA